MKISTALSIALFVSTISGCASATPTAHAPKMIAAKRTEVSTATPPQLFVTKQRTGAHGHHLVNFHSPIRFVSLNK